MHGRRGPPSQAPAFTRRRRLRLPATRSGMRAVSTFSVRRQRGDLNQGLEDEADRFRPQPGHLGLAELRLGSSRRISICPERLPVQPAEQVEQCGLAMSGAARTESHLLSPITRSSPRTAGTVAAAFGQSWSCWSAGTFLSVGLRRCRVWRRLAGGAHATRHARARPRAEAVPIRQLPNVTASSPPATASTNGPRRLRPRGDRRGQRNGDRVAVGEKLWLLAPTPGPAKRSRSAGRVELAR